MTTFRKTTQDLAPAFRAGANGQYNIYPAHPLGDGQIELGFPALARGLASRERVVLDGMGGVLWDDFRARLTAALASLGKEFEWLDVREALRPEPEMERFLAPFLGGCDPLFGTRNTRPLAEFFLPEKLSSLARRAAAGGRVILYGTGAALAALDGFLVYVDVPKNEIQFRARAGAVGNLGAPRVTDARGAYKRFYFADWPPLRDHQAGLLPRLDLVVDAQRPDEPALISGQDLRDALAKAARSWIRSRPWFEPGPWGGQWMKRHFPGLPAAAPNLAWSYELISGENGLAFESGGRLLEVAFDFLMTQDRAAILGDFAPRFGREFPIRFDYLDTIDGGNLSLQCHPRTGQARRWFGERMTQDETYYLTDCAPGARVFLGFQADVEPAGFERALQTSARESGPLAVEQFVQALPSRKHGLYLIPHGTVHCSGAGNLVLEISAAPYIFTFKMHDWQRLGLDGRPRALNIERAMQALRFDRQGARIAKEFVSRPRSLAHGPGWELIHLPTHQDHFYDVHRFDFSTSMEARTDGSPHVLNVVEGPSVLLETPGQPPQPFAFGETFIVPAAAEHYRLHSGSGRPVKVVKAFLKPESQWNHRLD